MIYNANYHENVCNCTAYIVLFFISFLIIIVIGISTAFVYFRWYFERSNTNPETIIYYEL